jgi:hypothetical protein
VFLGCTREPGYLEIKCEGIKPQNIILDSDCTPQILKNDYAMVKPLKYGHYNITVTYENNVKLDLVLCHQNNWQQENLTIIRIDNSNFNIDHQYQDYKKLTKVDIKTQKGPIKLGVCG